MKKICVLAAVIYMLFAGIPDSEVQANGAPTPSDAIYRQLASGQTLSKDRDYQTPMKPTVYLTFDDGPSLLTPQVLDLLKKEEIHATFFLLGKEAERYPNIVKRIVKEGHSIGNHTYNHKYSELYPSFEKFWSQIEKTSGILEQITGERTKLVRVPGGTFGHFDAFYAYYLDQADYQVYDWNIDSGDSSRRGVPANEIIRQVKKGPFPHEVHLLLHDGSGHAESVKALPEIIHFFKQIGYEFAPLTVKVKPISFHLEKVKQRNRPNLGGFEQNVAMVTGKPLDDLAVEREALPVYQGKVAAVESSEAFLRLNSTSLKVDFGQRSISIDPQNYKLSHGAIYVSLRQLVEGMGGRVFWDEEEKVANADYKTYHVECNLMEQTMKIYNLGQKVKVYHIPAMEILNGSLMVPLRDTIERLNNEIEEYTAKANVKEVYIRMNEPYIAFQSSDKFVERFVVVWKSEQPLLHWFRMHQVYQYASTNPFYL